MMPSRSTLVPIMNPGTSARYRSGTPNASHIQMKRAALSALSTNSTPPFCLGCQATIPTGFPSMRAKQVITSGANSFLISNTLSASTSSRMSANMSKNLF